MTAEDAPARLGPKPVTLALGHFERAVIQRIADSRGEKFEEVAVRALRSWASMANEV